MVWLLAPDADIFNFGRSLGNYFLKIILRRVIPTVIETSWHLFYLFLTYILTGIRTSIPTYTLTSTLTYTYIYVILHHIFGHHTYGDSIRANILTCDLANFMRHRFWYVLIYSDNCSGRCDVTHLLKCNLTSTLAYILKFALTNFMHILTYSLLREWELGIMISPLFVGQIPNFSSRKAPSFITQHGSTMVSSVQNSSRWSRTDFPKFMVIVWLYRTDLHGFTIIIHN